VCASPSDEAGSDNRSVERHPHIRSFALRRGRFTQAQRRAFDRWLPVYGVPYAAAPLDFTRVFGRAAPTILEIGCGMGEATAAIAQAYPNLNFIAVEVFTAGVGALLQRIDEMQLTNVRAVHHDAVEVVRDMIAPGSLAGIHIFFPDPWPKKRHHKRRLVRPTFVSLLADRLAPAGYLHCATDWPDYAQQMLDVLEAEPRLANQHTGFAPTPRNLMCERPKTKFHTRGEQLGHAVCDLVFSRTSGDDLAKGDGN
jgi:tRNA (guanine-N7-)-methyltransferase